MAQCSTDLRRTVPLYKVVNAAIIDVREDIGKVQQTFSHWAARGLKKLDREILKTGLRKVILTINKNTHTATLPPDFSEEIGVYLIDRHGRKHPLKLRPEIVDMKNVDEIECEDKCEKCNQDKSICNDLTVTEDTVIVVVNDMAVEQTIIKKLYPNGDYYLETKIPVWDIGTEQIVYATTKEFITNIDRKVCGCINETPENIEKIKSVAFDVWCSHFSPCDRRRERGGYRVFEESGLIQFDDADLFDKAYMEYYGFMPKKNGQYHVPEVAFETLVEFVKFMNVDGRKNIPNVDKKWRWDRYVTEKGNMQKEKGRISISVILESVGLIPKFDLDYNCGFDHFFGLNQSNTIVAAPISQAVCEPAAPSSVVVCPPSPVTKNLTPFQLAVICGGGANTPVAGLTTYQNDALKNAIGVGIIIVNNNIETAKANQFTFDPVTGIIDRSPNTWVLGDILVVNFSKLI